MNSLTKKIVIALSLLVVAYVTTGYVRARSSSNDNAFRALTVYSEVLSSVQRYYVDDPNMHKVTAGALHGLVDSLDPQSGYMSPLEYADYKKETAANPSAGAGLTLTKRDGYISVISALPNSSGAKAGLQFGDIIERIAGFTTAQMTVDQAQMLLSGEPGKVVKLAVIKMAAIRRGETESQPVTFTLEKVPGPKVVETRLQGGVAYLRVPAFDDGTSKQIREALMRFHQQGAHKLVIDLRDCSSGVANEGIETAQLFLQSGTIATLKGQTVTTETSSADPSKVVWTDPVTVLIGNSTAGPAEIFAGAIADNHRGDTVGDRTYGTASMQKVIPLDDGAALVLTVANYYTPNGKEIPVDGVAPSVTVRNTPDSYAQLEQVGPPAPPLGQVVSPDDPVLKKALDLLQNSSASQQKKAA
ncbi:MAG TPA: S41 family peptidase [Candidatus Acidoferrum sp.]|nr:S41 family peptidase [Candidatus Acidoferrum sp.]